VSVFPVGGDRRATWQFDFLSQRIEAHGFKMVINLSDVYEDSAAFPTESWWRRGN
jgi:hypothetical protein